MQNQAQTLYREKEPLNIKEVSDIDALNISVWLSNWF